MFTWYNGAYSKIKNKHKPPLKQDDRVRINDNIKALELRVIGPSEENLGVVSRDEAIKKAQELGLDLIEVSPKATPPVARIMDYGKYQYAQKKKQKKIKQKATINETKTTQVKIGTGDHDKEIKAKRISEWLGEGYRVRVDLFLFGRYRYMEEAFLKERFNQFLILIKEPYKIVDDIKKGPKGYTVTLERDKKGRIEKTSLSTLADVNSEK